MFGILVRKQSKKRIRKKNGQMWNPSRTRAAIQSKSEKRKGCKNRLKDYLLASNHRLSFTVCIPLFSTTHSYTHTHPLLGLTKNAILLKCINKWSNVRVNSYYVVIWFSEDTNGPWNQSRKFDSFFHLLLSLPLSRLLENRHLFFIDENK